MNRKTNEIENNLNRLSNILELNLELSKKTEATKPIFSVLSCTAEEVFHDFGKKEHSESNHSKTKTYWITNQVKKAC